MEKLEAEGMKDLYLEIELPLIYALYHMEEEGIAVKREELSAYGEKLKQQITVLEQEMCIRDRARRPSRSWIPSMR